MAGVEELLDLEGFQSLDDLLANIAETNDSNGFLAQIVAQQPLESLLDFASAKRCCTN